MYSVCIIIMRMYNYLDFSQDKIDHSIQTTLQYINIQILLNTMFYEYLWLFLSANVHQGNDLFSVYS